MLFFKIIIIFHHLSKLAENSLNNPPAPKNTEIFPMAKKEKTLGNGDVFPSSEKN
jgi:hypothetical protein